MEDLRQECILQAFVGADQITVDHLHVQRRIKGDNVSQKKKAKSYPVKSWSITTNVHPQTLNVATFEKNPTERIPGC